MILLPVFLLLTTQSSALDWELLDGRYVCSDSLVLSPSAGSDPVLAIHSNATTLLELSPLGEKSSVLKVLHHGVLTFDLSSKGEVVTQALRMRSGGIEIEAGGLHVDAGGIHVKGGLTIESGGLHMPDQKMSIESKQLNVPLYEGRTLSSKFVGNMLQLQSYSDLDFKFLSLSRHDQEVVSIHQDGLLKAKAIRTDTLTMKTISISADDTIYIPSDVSYVEISDDMTIRENILVLPEDDVPMGRVMAILNMDEQPTGGGLSIPSNTSVMLIYNGDRWIPMDSLKVPTEYLLGVRSLRAVDDLDIGDFTFTAASFSATKIPSGSLVVTGSKGVFEGAEGVSFSKGILKVNDISIQRLASDVDGQSRSIRCVLAQYKKLFFIAL